MYIIFYEPFTCGISTFEETTTPISESIVIQRKFSGFMCLLIVNLMLNQNLLLAATAVQSLLARKGGSNFPTLSIGNDLLS